MRIAATALAAAAIGAGAAALASDDPPGYSLDDTPVEAVGLTGMGLPPIGAHGTLGAGDYLLALRSYHDNGAYARDLAMVDGRARAYLQQRLAAAAEPAQRERVCRTRYVRVRGSGAGALFRRRRACHTATVAGAPIPGRPALVLDIDETALSNYAGIAATSFAGAVAGQAATAVLGTDPAIEPTLDLYRYARQHDVAVFFITGRPSVVASITQSNLRAAGYTGWAGLFTKPLGTTTVAFKSGARRQIEQRGYTILANVGDQDSDLAGGHAERAFKLPNPFYFVS